MKSLSLVIVIMLASCIISFGQVIEKMDKKELRIELSARRLELDSINNVILYLHTQITKNIHTNDSLVSVINQTRLSSDKNEVEKINLQKTNNDLTKINFELSKEIFTLKDSLAKHKSTTDNVDFLRELIINKYLRNKTFKLKYYNSRDGNCGEV